MDRHIYGVSMETQQKFKILFLCTANSARSLMAEAIFRQFADDSFEVTSAGTEPTQPEPEALKALSAIGVTTDGLRSKSLTEIDLPAYDYIISLCDRARTECQLLCSDDQFIAWDFPDPVTSKKTDAFRKTAHELSERIKMLLLILRKRSDRPQLFDAPNEFFKILSDPLRLQMILMLHKHGELCVCQFVDATGKSQPKVSQPKVSRHLAQLREYGLLSDRKDQRWVYYRINPALPDWMAAVIATTAEYHPQQTSQPIKDINNGCV
ncbi:metalloregulator ArsR/SmtB family transcription factor [Idiomarina seosinensis]|nr:metalloregulator ArsR/SmtB family transcription factor [Idiomarina seosinensis]